MSKSVKINVSRLKWSIQDAGLSNDELASKVHISLSKLKKVLQNENGLSPKQLSDIATFFNRGMLFFLNPKPINQKNIHSTNFRTIASKKPDFDLSIKSIIKKLEENREIFIGLLEEIDEFDETPWLPRELTDSVTNYEHLATQIRKWLQLDDALDLQKLRRLIAAKRIHIVFSSPYKGQWHLPKDSTVRGLSLYYDQYPIIFVKKQDSDTAQTFTIVHELAHLILHRDSSLDYAEDLLSQSGHEKEANHLAGLILIPDHFISQIDIGKLKSATFHEFDELLDFHKNQWGVSVEVILRRLVNEKLINSSNYQSYREAKSKVVVPKKIDEKIPRMYRHREPLHLFGKTYVQTVFDALSSQKITAVRAARFLDNIKVPDLRKLEKYVRN